ncbi:MAG: transcriptional repressor [Planctomycetota bacterium]
MDHRSKSQTADDLRDAFRRFLRENAIKMTTARKQILDVVLDLPEHFEADQVLYMVTERGFRIAKATVYRTLPLLVTAGILKQVRFDVKHVHYELAFGDRPHDHMVCRQCGRIFEFAADEVIDLRQRIADRFNFRAANHRFQITGLCHDCSRTSIPE